MAYEADRVVVDIIAKTGQLDQPVKQSATQFDANMSKMEASAGKVDKALGKTTIGAKDFARALAAAGGDLKKVSGFADEASTKLNKVGAAAENATRFGVRHATSLQSQRAAMSQLGFQAQDVAQQFALGVKPMTIFAQQGGQVIQALQLMGGGGNKFLAFLGGPWGIGLSVAAVALSPLIAKLLQSKDGVEELVEKLKEHSRQTHLSEEADAIWARTLDGLIDRQKKLNEELGKRLEVQSAVDRSDLDQSQRELETQSERLERERQRLADLRKQLTREPEPESLGPEGDPLRTQVEGRISQLQKAIKDSAAQVTKLEESVSLAQQKITKSQIIVGEAQGKALADLTERADLWAEAQLNILRKIQQNNPTLTPFASDLSAAFEILKKAVSDAGSVGVNFDATTKKSNALNVQLNLGQKTVKQYTTEILKLAKALQEQADAAKEAAKVKPVDQFKRSVIGAEGTGRNQLGSSAAGFGQFMPSTWLSYFNKLFPDKADLSNAAKLNFRNIRSVAEAVIDKATDDYVKVIKDAGQQLTAANLYAVHLLGSKDVKKLFAAAPGTQTSTFLSPQVLAGNPFLKGTAGSARDAIAKRIGDSSARVSSGAIAIAQQLEQEKERLRQFQNARASLEDDILDARHDQGLSAAEAAKIEHSVVEVARQKYEDNVNSLIEQGKYTEDEAKELIALNDERAKLRHELVERRRQQELFRQQEARNENALEVQLGLLDTQKEVLQSEEGLARTSAERKRIEDRLIDLQFEEEKMRLQAQINLAARLRAEAERTKSAQDIAIAERAEADAAIARARLAGLPARQAAAHTENAQANASPIQSYLDSIPQKAEEIDQALEAIAANGLQSFTDGLVDALVNFKSLGDVARSVLQQITAMLLKMVIQQLILKAFGAFLGKADGGPIGKAGGGRIGHFAPGGYIAGPGGPTSDDVPIMASAGEYMIKTRSAKKVGYSTLEYINRTGELPEHFAGGGQVRRIQPINTAAAGGGGRGGFSQQDIQALRSIVAEASRAMPDVSLYASLDPVDMLQRALGAPAGHRALLAHMGNNSNAYSGAINRR